ncbi:hypothetical protein M422DRAFT_41051 [Sphaerobolus stellatus SS14]|nr:hypothetical protein M422DRAFT_41051 [Sphaerobolus stellatus SS14]
MHHDKLLHHCICCATLSAAPLLTGCYIEHVESLFAIILYKARGMYKENRQSSLLKRIVRDSLCTVVFVHTLLWTFASLSLYQAAIWWQVAIPCALGSRLLLNIHLHYHEEKQTSIIGSTRVGFRTSTIPTNGGHAKQDDDELFDSQYRLRLM